MPHGHLTQNIDIAMKRTLSKTANNVEGMLPQVELFYLQKYKGTAIDMLLPLYMQLSVQDQVSLYSVLCSRAKE